MTTTATSSPAARAPFDPPLADSSDEFSVPAWEDLEPNFRDLLVVLYRWAHTIDGTIKRCKRRDCRTAEACMSSPEDGTPCSGSPGPNVVPMIDGMWLARSLDLDYVLPPNRT